MAKRTAKPRPAPRVAPRVAPRRRPETTPRETAVVHRLATLTNSETDLDRILNAIATEAASAFAADAASVAIEDDRGEFVLAASYGLSETYRTRRHLSAEKLKALYGDPPTECFAGAQMLATMGQPDLVRAERIQSLYLVPLVHRNRLVGSLGLYGRRRDIRLSSDEVRLAQLFAAEAAGALQRATDARALAEQIEDYDLLTRIGRVLVSRLDVDYEAILRMLHDQLGYEHLAIFSLESDPPQLVLKSYIGYGSDIEGISFPLGVGVVGWAAQMGAMAYVPDVSKDSRYVEHGRLNLGSLLVYPLKVGGQVLGALSVDSPELDAFMPRDRRILEAFADQCAIALSNSTQYAMARKRNESLSQARAELERYAASLERHHDELQLLNEVSAAAAKTLDLDAMLASAVKTIGDGLKVERCSVALLDGTGDVLEVVAEYRSDGGPNLKGRTYDVRTDSVFSQIIGLRRWVVSDDLHSDGRFERERETLEANRQRAAAMVPMIAEGDVVVGSLTVNTTTGPRHFGPDEVGALQTAANQLAMGVRNAQRYRREHELASEDSLTGLLNHRTIHERLDHELLRSARLQKSFALAVIDLDDFKQLNDTYGHQLGDDVLGAVSSALKACLRNYDMAGRYGGDEFFVLMPETDEVGAAHVLKRFAQSLDGRRIERLANSPIRWSAGIAVFPRDGLTKRELIAVADAAMYARKRTGSPA